MLAHAKCCVEPIAEPPCVREKRGVGITFQMRFCFYVIQIVFTMKFKSADETVLALTKIPRLLDFEMICVGIGIGAGILGHGTNFLPYPRKLAVPLPIGIIISHADTLLSIVIPP